MKKRIISMLLCLALMCALAVTAFAEDGETVISNINEESALIYNTELIAIYEATLYADGKTAQDVYCVLCKGLDFSEFDPTEPRSYASCVLIALSNEHNAYTNELIGAIKNNVPAGSKLVLMGHSLGGMVIQQVIAQKEIKDNYQVLNTVAIGSPYILTCGSKEGFLRRIVDRLDPVPYMSIPLLANSYMGNAANETSFLSPLVHFRSYKDAKCWRVYDCLGTKNGSAYIVLNELIYS